MSETSNWEAVRAHLEGLRRDLASEIGAYPAPITGCDAQFNHLIDQRRLVASEIARLDTAMGAPSGAVAEFVRASPLLDATMIGRFTTP